MATPIETARETYWRDCARESRRLAERTANEQARRAILAIAHNYEQLADWAAPAAAPVDAARACSGL